MNLIKTPEEIEIMRQGGKILATVLVELEKQVKPGITTLALNTTAEALILSHGAEPAFKGYDGFPYALCTSVNQDIVHGLPSEYILKEGDVVKLDLGVLYQGYNTDSAITVSVGNVSHQAKKLIEATRKSLLLGVQKAVIGNTTGDIGEAVETYVKKQGFAVVRNLCGHGIGQSVHEDPQVPNYRQKGEEESTLVAGMVICIEPMVVVGDWRIKTSQDGYGYATHDNKISAHFEHTIAITKNGPEILTKI